MFFVCLHVLGVLVEFFLLEPTFQFFTHIVDNFSQENILTFEIAISSLTKFHKCTREPKAQHTNSG